MEGVRPDQHDGASGVGPVVAAFVQRTVAHGDAGLRVEGDALMVDGWWPAALWLDRSTCLTRSDGCPRADVPGELTAGLAAIGLEPVEADLDAAIEAVSVGRLGLLGGDWQVWSTSVDAARAAVTSAASG